MGNIFSASNLLESNFKKPTTIEKINIEESYFVAALNLLEEMNNEIVSINKELYRSILESGDNVIAINESFSSFCASIKKIIEKFINFIKRIIQRFILTMNKIVKSDKYLTKHKKELDKFGPDDKFEMDVFTFTYLTDDNIPRLDPLEEWNKSQGYAENFKPGDTNTSLLSQVTAIYTNQKDKLNNGWYDSFRAKVINNPNGGPSSITSEDFAEELFKIFRNGSTEKSEEEISYDKVVDSLNRFEAYENNLKHVNENKKKLEKGYLDIKKEIETWASAGTDGKSALNVIFGDTNTNIVVNNNEYQQNKKEIDEQIDLFIKSKVNQIQHMCEIHAMAFTAKLDAIKACYTQDKAILYKALSKVQKHKNVTESYNAEEGEQIYGLLNY